MEIDAHLASLTSGCDAIYSVDELASRLKSAGAAGRPLRVKLGMDPTAPDLTLGHTVVLRKLRQFQDLGHKGVLIIGDYTAMIGDPTGRSKTRPVLSEGEVDANAATYLEQAGKVLNMHPDKLEVRRNSEWLGPMRFADVLRLTGQVTVARMLERDTFAERRAKGQEIYLHETLYPLMQAWDSVNIDADVELGGTDQTFNNLMGRDLQRSAGKPPQIVMVMPLLIGTDGHEKMSKSLGNYVGVTDSPGDMFGKLMSIPDRLMENYFTLLTSRAREEIERLVHPDKTHPRDAKAELAKTIITQYHSAEEAGAAEAEFFRIHRAGEQGLPDEIPELRISEVPPDGTMPLIEVVRACGFAATNGEARRLVAERGVRINGAVVDDPQGTIQVNDGDVVQRGKRKFVRLKLTRT